MAQILDFLSFVPVNIGFPQIHCKIAFSFSQCFMRITEQFRRLNCSFMEKLKMTIEDIIIVIVGLILTVVISTGKINPTVEELKKRKYFLILGLIIDIVYVEIFHNVCRPYHDIVKSLVGSTMMTAGILIGIALFVMVIILPINIAKYRGIADSKLSTIKLLIWFSLLLGITWFIALVMSLVYERHNNELDINQLSKLNDLKKDGIISEDDFNRKKNELLHKNDNTSNPIAKRKLLIAIILGVVGLIAEAIFIGFAVV